MTVVEWSDAHKIRALQRQVETMTQIAAAREQTIRDQAQQISALQLELGAQAADIKEIRELASRALDRLQEV